jgi:hypothetical protein
MTPGSDSTGDLHIDPGLGKMAFSLGGRDDLFPPCTGIKKIQTDGLSTLFHPGKVLVQKKDLSMIGPNQLIHTVPKLISAILYMYPGLGKRYESAIQKGNIWHWTLLTALTNATYFLLIRT